MAIFNAGSVSRHLACFPGSVWDANFSKPTKISDKPWALRLQLREINRIWCLQIVMHCTSPYSNLSIKQPIRTRRCFQSEKYDRVGDLLTIISYKKPTLFNISVMKAAFYGILFVSTNRTSLCFSFM